MPYKFLLRLYCFIGIPLCMAFYLPGLAPVNYCKAPDDNTANTESCKVVTNLNIHLQA